MQPKVKTRQDYQSSQETPQQGGGISRQSAAKGSASFAQPDHQGRHDDMRASQAGSRSTHRNGARGH